MKTPQPIHRPLADLPLLAAWREQLTEATRDPMLRVQLAQRESTLFPQFATYYQRLTSLPRRTRRNLQRQWKRSLAGVALLLTLGQGQALAATIAVDGACTLADAIIAANNDTAIGGCPAGSGADTITLPEGSTQTLTAVDNFAYGPTGLPVIESEITIQGNGSTIARDSAAPPFRILTVNSSGNLTLQQTTITGGHIPGEAVYYIHNNGGGIANYSGMLTLTDSTVSGNTAVFRGGGVYNAFSSTATITQSTVSGNTAAFSGGGVYNAFSSTATITQSTVSGNTAGISGGGVYNSYGTLTLTHSTVSGNTADDGGGVFNYYGTFRLEHTLVSGNTASRGAEVHNGYFIFSDNAYLGALYANNYNLFGHSGLTNAQAFVNFTPGISDINATSGYLAIPLGDILQADGTGTPALQDNGGPTKTIALEAGSPAIDAVTDGSCPPPEIDQRGVARPIDGDRSDTAECDIGAFEFDAGALDQNCSILQLLVDQYPLKARRIVARALADILHVTESHCRTGPD